MLGEPDVTRIDGAAPLIDDISGDCGFNFVVTENNLVCHLISSYTPIWRVLLSCPLSDINCGAKASRIERVHVLEPY